MVSGGKLTLRVEVDAQQFNQILKTTGSNLDQFKGKVDKVKPAMDGLGESTATNAIRFQTMAQGAINLTTAFTQTFTSISNLQRAKTSLAAAAIGVERSIDLEKRKQFQLNEEMKKAAPNMSKVKLLTNELATAHDDLAVKQQRVKDQADNVNDTYTLFALNIANVGFSAVQTGVSMLQMAKGIKLATVATKLMNVATSKYTIIALALIAVYEGIVQAIGVSNKAFKEQFSIISNVSKLMDEFGGASDITLDNYADKIGSATDATDEFGTSWENMTDKIKTETNKQKNIADEWADHWAKAYERQIANQQIAIAGARLTAQTGGQQANFQKGSNATINLPLGAVGAVAGALVVADIYNKINNIFDVIVPKAYASSVTGEGAFMAWSQKLNDSAPYIPQNDYGRSFPNEYAGYPKSFQGKNIEPSSFYDRLTLTRSQINAKNTHDNPLSFGNIYGGQRIGSGISGEEFEKNFRALSNPIGQPLGPEPINQLNERYRKVTTAQGRLNELLKNGTISDTLLYQLGILTLEKLDLEEEINNVEMVKNPNVAPPFKPKKVFNQAEFDKEFKENLLIDYPSASKIKNNNVNFRNRVEYIRDKAINDFFKPFREMRALLGPGKGDITKESTLLESKNGNIFFGGTGGSFLAKLQDTLKGDQIGSYMLRNGYFGQSGLGTSLLKEFQLMDQEINGPHTPRGHRTGVDFRKMQPVDATKSPIEQAFEAFRNMNMGPNTSAGFGGISQAMIEAGATFQDAGISEFSSSRLKQNLNAASRRARQLSGIRDDNLNKLRNGGNLREGYNMGDLYDPNAVVGGFKSISAFRSHQRLEFWRQSTAAQINLGTNFGIFNHIGSGSPSVANAARARAISDAANISQSFAMTGQSITYLGVRKTHRGGGYVQSGAQWAAHTRAVQQANQAALARAAQIQILNNGFGLPQFIGSQDGGVLALELAKQDQLIASIGLNRSEAFRIIDTDGRGRVEIDDRLRFHDRLNSMSSGVSPL